MVYLYDNAICDDLRRSLGSSTVSVVGPDKIVEIAAQLQEDKIHFPLVCLYRKRDMPIDTSRSNFSRMHFGVQAVIDHETNNLYYERSIPVKLSYELHVLATNQADIDELTRELMFKFVSMYYLTIKLPYESDRKVRFGVVVDQDEGIDQKSGVVEYLTEGTIYQSTMTLNCEGCNLIHYTPAHLKRVKPEVEAKVRGQ